MGILSIKKTKPEVASEEALPKVDPHKQTPYGGSIKSDKTGRLVPVETAPHMMVIGPTGVGKTTRVLGPGALRWRGPRVLLSSKTDFMKLTIDRGLDKRGPIYVMDLAGEVDEDAEWLQGVNYKRVVCDPTALINNDDEAMAMAALILQMGPIGAGGGFNSGGNDAFWQTLSAQPLAALLLAGQLSGEGINWTRRAAGRTTGETPDDMSVPSWVGAIKLLSESSLDSCHTEELNNAIGMEDKLRDSMIATMKSGLNPWILSAVRGGAGDKAFHPKMLEGPGEPTLYVTAPTSGAAAGAAVSVIEMIIRHWRKRVEKGLRPVLLSIDEFANCSPIFSTDRIMSEGRSLGIRMVLVLQDSAQLFDRFGESKGKAILGVAPSILLLDGSAEFDLLEIASKWSGERDVWRKSIDANQRESMSAERAPVRSVSELLPRSVEEGRLLLYGKEGERVKLPGIWQI